MTEHPDRLPPGKMTPTELYHSLKHLPFNERWKKFNEQAGPMCGLTPNEPYAVTKARERGELVAYWADEIFGDFDDTDCE